MSGRAFTTRAKTRRVSVPTLELKTVSDITINEPTSKPRERNGRLLTDRLCETRVAKRVKHYDRKCRGLYVSITPAGVAAFSCNSRHNDAGACGAQRNEESAEYRTK
jgi:hypothetical protein